MGFLPVCSLPWGLLRKVLCKTGVVYEAHEQERLTKSSPLFRWVIPVGEKFGTEWKGWACRLKGDALYHLPASYLVTITNQHPHPTLPYSPEALEVGSKVTLHEGCLLWRPLQEPGWAGAGQSQSCPLRSRMQP